MPGRRHRIEIGAIVIPAVPAVAAAVAWGLVDVGVLDIEQAALSPILSALLPGLSALLLPRWSSIVLTPWCWPLSFAQLRLRLLPVAFSLTLALASPVLFHVAVEGSAISFAVPPLVAPGAVPLETIASFRLTFALARGQGEQLSEALSGVAASVDHAQACEALGGEVVGLGAAVVGEHGLAWLCLGLVGGSP